MGSIQCCSSSHGSQKIVMEFTTVSYKEQDITISFSELIRVAEQFVAYNMTKLLLALCVLFSSQAQAENKEKSLELEEVVSEQVEDASDILLVCGRQLNKIKMAAKLASLKQLTEGWDGYHALPIDQTVLFHLSSLIDLCQDSDLDNWMLFPETNGSIILDYKIPNCRAAISIGSNGFSYYILLNSIFAQKEEEPFDKYSAYKLIQSINNKTI